MPLLLSEVSVAQPQAFRRWSALPDYAVLALIAPTWLLAGDRLFRLHARLDSIGPGRCRAAGHPMSGPHTQGFWSFVVPWIAPRIVPGAGGMP